MKQTLMIKAVLVASTFLIAGCITTSKQDLPSEYHEWAFTETQTTELASALAPTLENANVGDKIDIGDTKIGVNGQLEVTQRYFAASGRPCFKGVIQHSNGERESIICRYAEGDWRVSRAVATKFEPDNAQPELRSLH